MIDAEVSCHGPFSSSCTSRSADEPYTIKRGRGPPKACSACRKNKSKCAGNGVDPCVRCARLGKECVYPAEAGGADILTQPSVNKWCKLDSLEPGPTITTKVMKCGNGVHDEAVVISKVLNRMALQPQLPIDLDSVMDMAQYAVAVQDLRLFG